MKPRLSDGKRPGGSGRDVGGGEFGPGVGIRRTGFPWPDWLGWLVQPVHVSLALASGDGAGFGVEVMATGAVVERWLTIHKEIVT